MADSKHNRTEKPTGRRLQKTRKKGNIPRSQELPAALSLGAFIVFARLGGGPIVTSAERVMTDGIRKIAFAAPGAPGALAAGDPSALADIWRSTFLAGAAIVAPIVGFMLIASLAGQFAQGGFVFSTHPFMPKPEAFNPVTNLKGIFSMQRLVTALKTSLKLVLVSWLAYVTVAPEMPRIQSIGQMTPAALFAFCAGLSGRVLTKFFLFLIVVAGADYAYKRYEHYKGLKMSKKEIKDEHKESEGDPHVKNKIRMKMFTMARRRMMADVPKASVILVNPTHCAVALQYSPLEGGAPKVVAKGVDHIAAKIREIAEEHQIPIYENPPLTWSLFRAVDIGREIPAEMYKAVAEVLAHVFRLKAHGRNRRAGAIRPAASRPPASSPAGAPAAGPNGEETRA
jgi:flagellar biosynthetic protein FlhB